MQRGGQLAVRMQCGKPIADVFKCLAEHTTCRWNASTNSLRLPVAASGAWLLAGEGRARSELRLGVIQAAYGTGTWRPARRDLEGASG